jgi:methionine-rich copper-binding protein CopC
MTRPAIEDDCLPGMAVGTIGANKLADVVCESGLAARCQSAVPRSFPMWFRSIPKSPKSSARPAASRGRRLAPGNRRPQFNLLLDTLEHRVTPAIVGYYQMDFEEGNVNQETAILAAGDTPVHLFDLSSADLAGIDVLDVQNGANEGYGGEYLSRLADIEAAVAGGMVLVIHDRYVDGAESILPGGETFNIVRDFEDGANIDVLDDSTLVTNGPGGAVDNSTLDGGNSSSHGFAFADSLPASAALILSQGDPTHVVTFAYGHGAGTVIYSSIPLDFYRDNGGHSLNDIYAPNVLAYAATNSQNGFAVTATNPARGSVVATTPTQYVVNVSDALAPETVDAADFQVNGIPATAFTYTPGTSSITFTFASDPVTAEGLQTMHVADGAFATDGDGTGVREFTGTFRYDVVLMQVTSTDPADGSTIPAPAATLDLNFNEAYNFASAQTSDFTLNQGFVSEVSQVDADTLRLTLSEVNADGTLTVHMSARAMTDVHGNPGAAFFGSYLVPPSVSIDDVTVAEGNTGPTIATFTLFLSYAYGTPITVHYETADGTAAAGSDYTATSGDVTFAAGETVMTIPIEVIGDRTPESTETFTVNLTSNDAVIGDGQGVGAILDDEPTVFINDTTVTEGNAGTVTATFTVSLSGLHDEDVIIPYTTANGTATAGSDYAAKSGNVTIAAGSLSNTVTVLVTGDRSGEPTENFFVNLGAPTNAAIADGQGVGSILDNEPRISIGNVSQKEGKGNGKNTTAFVFRVTLSAAYDQTVTVNYATVAGGTATAGSDYRPKNGSVTFLPGQTTQTITILVFRDNTREPDETFFVDLSSPSGNALISNPRGIGTILNDDR